jgi:hypothetical protein
VVDLLVSGHDAQSESQKPLTCRDESDLKNNHFPGLVLRYLRICKPVNMCSFVGADKN